MTVPAPALATLVAPDGRSRASLTNGWTLGAPRAALAYEATLRGTPVVAPPGPASGVDAPTLLDGRGPGDARLLRLASRGWVRDARTERAGGSAFACATSSGFVRAGTRPVRHRRAICLFDEGELAIVDEWSGDGTAHVEMRFPLASGVSGEPAGEGARWRGPGGALGWLVVPGFSVGVARVRGEDVPSALSATADLSLPVRAVHAWTTGAERPTVSVRVVGVGDVRVEIRSGTATRVGHVPRWEAP